MDKKLFAGAPTLLVKQESPYVHSTSTALTAQRQQSTALTCKIVCRTNFRAKQLS
jgi:hypothetical protein